MSICEQVNGYTLQLHPHFCKIDDGYAIWQMKISSRCSKKYAVIGEVSPNFMDNVSTKKLFCLLSQASSCESAISEASAVKGIYELASSSFRYKVRSEKSIQSSNVIIYYG